MHGTVKTNGFSRSGRPAGTVSSPGSANSSSRKLTVSAPKAGTMDVSVEERKYDKERSDRGSARIPDSVERRNYCKQRSDREGKRSSTVNIDRIVGGGAQLP